MKYSWDVPPIDEVEHVLKNEKEAREVFTKIRRISSEWSNSEFEKLLCFKLADSAFNFIDFSLPYDVNIGAFNRDIGEVVEVKIGIGFFISLMTNGIIFDLKEDNQGQINELIDMLKYLCDYYQRNPDDIKYNSLNDDILPIRHWLYYRLKKNTMGGIETTLIESIFDCKTEDIVEMVNLSPKFHFHFNQDLSAIYIEE